MSDADRCSRCNTLIVCSWLLHINEGGDETLCSECVKRDPVLSAYWLPPAVLSEYSSRIVQLEDQQYRGRIRAEAVDARLARLEERFERRKQAEFGHIYGFRGIRMPNGQAVVPQDSVVADSSSEASCGGDPDDIHPTTVEVLRTIESICVGAVALGDWAEDTVRLNAAVKAWICAGKPDLVPRKRMDR
jgi:hypothetical protein